MMRQLSCGITHEDFDEKAASKAPMQSTTSDSHTHISSSNSLSNNIELISSRGSATVTATATATATATVQKAATKPWIWTSNTIDTSEYGSPTRHRRETEDTYSTAGGISLSTTTETTAAPFTSNPLPETNRQRPSPSKSSDVLSTRKTRPSTLEVSSTLETISSTEETSNAGEYPSINQGQLFSIIENGTMFDIIEVNDTSESDSKMEKTTIKSLTISPMTAIFDTLLTTKIPPPSIAAFGKSAKGNSNKSPNDLAEGQAEKTFMKAIEMEAFPLNINSSVDVKLNRTNRKELPLLVSPDYTINSTEHTDFKQIDKDFTISTSEVYPTAKDVSNDNHQHKIVEITITDIERKTDATKLYVTTKKYDKKKEKMINSNEETMYKKQKKKNVAPTADVNIHIDVSEMPVLASVENITNSEVNANTNANSNTTLEEDNAQIYIDSKMADFNYKNFTKVKGTNLTTKLIDENGEYEEHVEKNVEVKTTEEPMEAIPEAQPRPNRNRVLTRPQRRSFYPYFFSRVLG